MSCPTHNNASTLELQLERANFIGTALSAVAYGTHITLFVMTLRYYLRPIGRRDWLSLAYSVLLLSLATAGLALELQWDIVVFIDHGNCPGGPFTFLSQDSGNPTNVAMTSIFIVMNWLVDALLLYRICSIFCHKWSAWFLSILLLVALIAVGCAFLPDLAALGLDLRAHVRNPRCVAFLALSLSLNVIISCVILIRVLYLYHGIWNSFTGPTTCTSLVAVLTTSETVYSILTVAVIIVLAVDSPVQAAFLPILGQLQAIPPVITILRLVKRRHQALVTPPSVLQFKPTRGPLSPIDNDSGTISFPISFESTGPCHPPFEPEARVDLEAGKYDAHMDYLDSTLPHPLKVHIV
ncbi:hypothetical protein BKA93DRAFT_344713 [Sparassis latifolia]